MVFRSLLAGLTLVMVTIDSEAGIFRRRAQPVGPPVYRSPTFTPTAVMPVGVSVSSPTPGVTSPAEHVSGYAPAMTPAVTAADFSGTAYAPADGLAGDGLDEVNAQRAARGQRPFLRDEGLTQAARACAQFRAAHGLFGHTANDFAFVPAGTFARSAGCAAYPAGYGWMSCCVHDNHTYAGAAWVTGRDGRRYMHLFVR